MEALRPASSRFAPSRAKNAPPVVRGPGPTRNEEMAVLALLEKHSHVTSKSSATSVTTAVALQNQSATSVGCLAEVLTRSLSMHENSCVLNTLSKESYTPKEMPQVVT